ncbi:MAG: adenosylhomocysteinase [Patescibacteria group bacterium]
MSQSIGARKINWVAKQMPVLEAIKSDFKKRQSFSNVKISACLHVTAETANLVLALKAGGAQVALCGSNPLSTQNDIVQSLKRDYKMAVFAKRGINNKEYYNNVRSCLVQSPQLTVDDGADLVTYVHTKNKRWLKKIWGGTEETTTGVSRLKIMAQAKKLSYPIIAVNSALTKHLFDNRYGTGQSTIDGIIRATNVLIAGKVVVVAGYGWCGRGVAMRARGLGARVVVTEVDPVKALEVIMDGFEILTMKRAAVLGDIFVTVTGDIDVITKEHLTLMKDGAIICNSGHFDVEINLADLKRLSVGVTDIRSNLQEYKLRTGKNLYLLAEGRLVNLAAAEGHPAAVMDMSFANQALALEYLVANKGKLENKVYSVPAEIDIKIAQLKLKALGLTIDSLSSRQKKYINSWQIGT